MPSSLLDSQLATLEHPADDENVLLVDATGKSAAEVADSVLHRLSLVDSEPLA